MPNHTEPCVIGPGTQIQGRLTGREALVIEGRVEGTIVLESHLIVETSGVVVADIEATELTVRGKVQGNISVSTSLRLVADAILVGDIRAPRVLIEDGARFKGNIDMDVPLPDGL